MIRLAKHQAEKRKVEEKEDSDSEYDSEEECTPIQTDEDFDIAVRLAQKTDMFIALGFTPLQSRIMGAYELGRKDLVASDVAFDLARNRYQRDLARRAVEERDDESLPEDIEPTKEDDSTRDAMQAV